MSKKTKKIVKWIGLGLLTIVIGVASGATFYIYKEVNASDRIFAYGTTVQGVDLGGLTEQEGEQLLTEKLNKELENTLVTIASSEEYIEIHLKDLGVEYSVGEVLQKAFENGHRGNFFERYERYYKKIPVNASYTLEYSYSVDKIKEVLYEYEELFTVEPIDATITRTNKQFIITKEQEGEMIDIIETAKKIEERIWERNMEEPIYIVTKTIEPSYTAEALKNIQTPISSFATSYNNADLLRNENLKVAALKINTVLAPGEVFSLGEQLEPITYEQGYRASKVIVAGRLEDGIGGGVCQVASTLYNAVLLSNLNIVQRQNHSLPVAYVQLGRDATYASGVIDFRFENNSEYPIFIESYCENNQVYVNIFGHQSVKPSYDEIKFESETIETITPPAPTYIDDPTLEKGKQVQEINPLYGYKVKLYRLYYKDGKLVEKEYLNLSYYRPRAAIIRRGIKEVQGSTAPLEGQSTVPNQNDMNNFDPNAYDPNEYIIGG
jgi:vancomycin resistance protein YoaR